MKHLHALKMSVIQLLFGLTVAIPWALVVIWSFLVFIKESYCEELKGLDAPEQEGSSE